MRVKLNVSTTSGAKPGDTVELSDTEGRSLVAQGFATKVEDAPRVPAKKKPKATAKGDDTINKEG